MVKAVKSNKKHLGALPFMQSYATLRIRHSQQRVARFRPMAPTIWVNTRNWRRLVPDTISDPERLAGQFLAISDYR